MLDTVNFWLDNETMGTDNPFSIVSCLDDVEERQSAQRGYYCKGKLGDYTITVNPAGVYMSGSLSKYYLPSNVYTLTRSAIKEAIESLSDNLKINVAAATVKRVDVSTVIPTKRRPADYYSRLGTKPHFKRLQAAVDTLYYNTVKRQLIFYDKSKEATAKGAIIPPTLTGCNLLRYELRFTRMLQKQFRQQEKPTAAILYDTDFYYWLVSSWRDEFLTINKIKTVSIMSDIIKTPKDAANALFAALLQSNGGSSVIDGVLQDLKAAKCFDDPKNYTRLKNHLNDLLQTPAASGQNDLIRELEQAIVEVAKYAR